MNLTEQRLAIALAHKGRIIERDGDWFFVFDGSPVPDYPNDDEAMSCAEEVMHGENLANKYEKNVGKVMMVEGVDRPFLWKATIRQRAEGFLKTLGRWVE